MIKLPENATEDDHLVLLGVLNSSTACFWLKQVSQNKGNGSDRGGSRRRGMGDRYEFTGTKLEEFPLPADSAAGARSRADALAQQLAA